MGRIIKMISLFAGIGGFDLAADTLGWEILFQSEIDPFCLEVLKKHFPNIPKYGNINEINAKKYRGNVDVVAGGFPCQPFSNAGLQRGTEDPRFLWPAMYRVIQECRPTWPGEHFKAFRQTKKQLPDCMYFESWFQSVRYYSELDGVVYGIPDWMDRTHALGNSIDPRIAYEILITIDYLINR